MISPNEDSEHKCEDDRLAGRWMDGDRECIVVIRDEMHNQGHKLQGGVVVTNGGGVMGGCNVNSAYLHVSVYLNDSAVSRRMCVYVVKLCICMCPHPYPKKLVQMGSLESLGGG